MKIDFTSGRMAHRITQGGGKSQAIAKACGIHKHGPTRIIDATAGLCMDSWILANLGCTVELVERNEAVANVIETALTQALQHETWQKAAARITLHTGDAKIIIPTLDAADTIYLDPMFPMRTKSALVKINMRDLKAVVGNDEDADALLPLALEHALKRVVVKRPAGAPYLDGRNPHYELKGKSNRFDIYI
jgi:16S rRNA (guanine1516-N2)-methyltransferase